MKKILIILLALAMVFGLAACGNGNGGNQQAPPAQDANGENGTADVVEEELIVGFILIGSITDGGFTQAHYEGLRNMEAHFGGRVRAIFMESVPAADSGRVRSAGEGLIDMGARVVIGNSFGYMPVMNDMAQDFPDVTFLHFSGNMSNDTNFDNFFGSMEEPRFLTGMVAGMMTESNILGYVGAFPNTEVLIGINAFALGAQYVNPDAVVEVIFINAWGDAVREREAAETLLDMGADVIAQHTDSPGPIIAAEERGAFGIAYNLDKPDSAPGAYLTAPVWNHGAYYIKVIEQILAGTFRPFSFYGTMADGYVDIAPLTHLVPNDVREVVMATRDRMLRGEFHPFSVEVYFADGTLFSPAGETPDRAKIWTIEQAVRGVNAVIEN